MDDRVKNRVREFRRNADLTQEALAREMMVSRQTIISIERGKYIPSLPLALRMARYFGSPADEMFYFEED